MPPPGTAAAGERVVLVCDGRQLWPGPWAAGSHPIFGTSVLPHNPAPWASCATRPVRPWRSFRPGRIRLAVVQLVLHAQPLILDTLLPAGYRPIVQVIDNYDRCHKLGLVFEAR